MISIVIMLLALPLLSFVLITLLQKKIGTKRLLGILGIFQIVLNACTLIATYPGKNFYSYLSWFEFKKGHVLHIGIYVDFLAALMLSMISLISWIIYQYSIGYLSNEISKKRYFALLTLFISAVSWVVVADNLWAMLIGWEIVGIVSCLLIGFWYQENAPVKASIHAYFTSKIGSICFLIGIFLLVNELPNSSLITITQSSLASQGNITFSRHIAGICFLIAAFTKSAQLPFFSWLSRAMAAPTPISALLHGATIISIGIYLLIRVQPIFSQHLSILLVIIGYLTAFMGACAALYQEDIKRMLAYSTISQLGYVTAAIGTGLPAAAITFLLVHGFAKACLFLCAGVILKFLQQQGITDENSRAMSRMGGMIGSLPWVAVSYLIAVLSLVGLPGLTGFLAKETILEKTLVWSIAYAQSGYYIAYLIPLLGFIASFLTPLYLGKSFILIFFGVPIWKPNRTMPVQFLPNNSYWVMQRSILTFVGCIVVFSLPFTNRFIINGSKKIDWCSPYKTSIISNSVYIPHLVTSLSIGLLVLASLLLVVRFKQLRATNSNVHFNRTIPLFQNGWYLDVLSNIITSQLLAYSRLIAKVENDLINRLVTLIAMFYVVTAHIIGWLDNNVVAGVGYGIGITCKSLSKLYLQLHKCNIQYHLIWTFIASLLVLVGWMLYSNFI